MISGPDILNAAPVIASLVVIEGLLSVDNALAIGALASHLPPRERRIALRAGMLGAYVTRGVALLLAAWTVRNPWMKLLGAIYLVYLMTSHLSAASKTKGQRLAPKPGLLLTIVQLELLDLSLSLDNVITAVAMSQKLWVVFTGVFIGVLALRFLAGVSVRLIQRMPVLESAAFMLVGYVGLLLCYETLSGVELHSLPKFVGIVLIIALSFWYARAVKIRRVLDPGLRLFLPLMRTFTAVVEFLAWPLRAIVGLAAKAIAPKVEAVSRR